MKGPLRSFLAATLALLWWSSVALADVPYRIRDWRELGPATTRDVFLKVKGAKVLWADYQLLRRDFPFLAPYSENAIDLWIVDEFAYISRKQLHLSGIRTTPIPLLAPTTPGFSKVGYRPYRYQRAAVFSVGNGLHPMVDLKGLGNDRNAWWPGYSNNHYRIPLPNAVATQLARFHGARFLMDQGHPDAQNTTDSLLDSDNSSGVMGSVEGIAEVLRQRIAQSQLDMEFNHSPHRLQTAENYFLMALPMQLLRSQGRQFSTTIVGRQSTFRLGVSMGLNVPKHIYIDVAGGRQGDAFLFSALDFGAVSISNAEVNRALETLDPRFSQWSKYDSNIAVGISTMVDQQLKGGDQGAVRQFIRNVDQMLDHLSRSSTGSRMDQANPHFQQRAQNQTLSEYVLDLSRNRTSLPKENQRALVPAALGFCESLERHDLPVPDEVAAICASETKDMTSGTRRRVSLEVARVKAAISRFFDHEKVQATPSDLWQNFVDAKHEKKKSKALRGALFEAPENLSRAFLEQALLAGYEAAVLKFLEGEAAAFSAAIKERRESLTPLLVRFRKDSRFRRDAFVGARDGLRGVFAVLLKDAVSELALLDLVAMANGDFANERLKTYWIELLSSLTTDQAFALRRDLRRRGYVVPEPELAGVVRRVVGKNGDCAKLLEFYGEMDPETLVNLLRSDR
jgi:hypothetical protein